MAKTKVNKNKNKNKTDDKSKDKEKTEAERKAAEEEKKRIDALKADPNKYTIQFANEEIYDITLYDPSQRCKAVKEVKGKRDFSLTKSGTVGGGNQQIDVSGVKPKVARQIAEFLLTKEVSSGNYFNASHIAGILGNIQVESDFKVDAYTANDGSGERKGPSGGICQWHEASGKKGRFSAMKEACGGGEKWKTNLDGQLNYLWKELTGSESATLKALATQVTVNSLNQAYKACEIWDDKFERSSGQAIETRKRYTKKFWGQIKITEGTTGSGKKYNLSDADLKALTAGCIQENGTTKQAIQGEASLMCHLYERKKNRSMSLRKYIELPVKQGGWFGVNTRNAVKNGNPTNNKMTKTHIGYAREVFNGGLRTIPDYIDEHDQFADIVWMKYNGDSDTKVYGNYKSSKMISGKTVIHNNSGATYTFWLFMIPKGAEGYPGDPYGSLSTPKKYSG